MWRQVFLKTLSYWKWFMATFLPLVLWEIFKDRISGWANNQIDESASANAKELVGAIDWLASGPAGWSILIFVSVLCVLLVHSYSFEHQEKVSTVARNGTEKQPQKTKQTVAPPGEPFPDMTIRELFHYICDETGFDCELLEDDNWKKIGEDVRDKASVGQLTFWGRAYSEQFGDMLGKNPLTEVSKEYWKEGDFTYQFFGGWGDDPPHTFPGPREDELRDLQVNKMQAKSIWPPISSDKIVQNRIGEIRQDVFRLKEALIDYTPYESVAEEVAGRLQRLKSSDNLVWTDESMNQMRLDYLNSCGWAATNEKKFNSPREDQDVRREINRRAIELNKALEKREK